MQLVCLRHRAAVSHRWGEDNRLQALQPISWTAVRHRISGVAEGNTSKQAGHAASNRENPRLL